MRLAQLSLQVESGKSNSDGVRFALERDDLTVEHYVPAGVAVAA